MRVRKARKRVPRGRIEEFVKKLRKLYNPQCRIWHGDPFRVLIGTIISQRTRDEQTALATGALFSKLQTPEALAGARVREIAKLIKPAGFYNVKARKIKEVAGIILDRFDGTVPDDMDDLLSLPSVGRKTANCVLVYGFNRDAIPVDTHVHRISNRLGWVSTKSPDETERALTELLPKKYWLEINDLMVTHGREICRPIGPRCDECPVIGVCDHGNNRK